MTDWSIISHSTGRADYQMAVDEAIFRLFVHDLDEDPDRAASGCMRFYRISPQAVSIGYRQKSGEVTKLPGVRARNLEVVRRITGGGAVFHGTDLTVSMIFCDGVHGYGVGTLPSYRFVVEVVRDGLQAAGVRAEIAESAEERVYPSVCFERSSKFELECYGRKIFGCALRRHGRAGLVQGSIIFDGSQECLGLKTGSAELLRRGNLKVPSSQTMVSEITAALGRIQGTSLHRRSLSDSEKVLAGELRVNRYGTKAWTRHTVSVGSD